MSVEPPAVVMKAKKMLPYHGLKTPIGFSPYQVYSKQERKLFVGMLNKKYSESDVRQLFQSYGPIEECTVLRDANSHSKGCAFVTFASRQYAIAAIKGMHQQQTMEGCSAPLVVKFADTQREKDAKRLQNLAANLWTNAGANATALSPQYLALLQQLNVGSCLSPLTMAGVTAMNGVTAAAMNGVNGVPALGTPQLLPAALQNGQDFSSVTGLAPLAASLHTNCAAAAALPSGGSSQLSPLSVPTSLGLAGPLTSLGGPVTSLSGSLTSLGGPVTSLTGLGAPAADTLGSLPALHQFPGYSLSGLTAAAAASSPGAVSGRQQEGPEGANLFIYHLPQEFTDADLVRTFSPFGTVLSAKVFIDKNTNLSKCFGFVSYDNTASSQAAIQSMNGFQVGTKRLKVQLKRSRDTAKPY